MIDFRRKMPEYSYVEVKKETVEKGETYKYKGIAITVMETEH